MYLCLNQLGAIHIHDLYAGVFLFEITTRGLDI